MKLRDAAIVAAVLLVGGIAAADTVWNRDSEPRPPASADRVATTELPPPAEAISGDEAVPLPLKGTLVFTATDDCRLRAASIERGLERVLPVIPTSCSLWSPSTGEHFAFGSPQSTDAAAFGLVDVNRPEEILRRGIIVGPVVWSHEGGHAAWCETATSGLELAVDDLRLRPLAFCPRAYVGGRLASTRDRAVVVDGRVVATAAGHIEQVAAGRDGSLALALEGGRVERRDRRGRTYGVRLPSDAIASSLIFAPDTCAVAAVGRLAVSIIDLGCFRGRRQVTTVSTDNCTNRRELATAECARYPAPRTFVGHAAAWSPDGDWLVVAEPAAITFHRIVGGYRVVRWPAAAADLVWLS